jgi:hypothetical protein
LQLGVGCVQATAFPHWPAVPHVCTEPLPEHWVATGVQTALHSPAVTAPLCHAPLESHVCGTAPLHCVAPGVHATQAPFKQMGVVPAHAAPQAPQWFWSVCSSTHVPLHKA